MIITSFITVLLFIGGIFVLLISFKGKSSKTKGKQIDTKEEQDKIQKMQENPYDSLRHMAFGVTTEQLGLADLKDDDIYGVIMDWDFGNGIMTLRVPNINSQPASCEILIK